MTRTARQIAAASLAALAAAAAIIAADFTPPASAQSDESAGRIVARQLANGRVEFGWQPTGGARVLPQSRYFPADPGHNRWLRSSAVEVGGAEIGRINARRLRDGRIEFAFTPTDGERILPQSRYFPADPGHHRWLRSAEITIGPASSGAFIAVSAGENNTCAIRDNGAIECWGRNTQIFDGGEPQKTGQTNAPSGRFRAVSVGHYHTCAIRSESGEIACWGSNLYGQTNAPSGRFHTISAEQDYTCAIRESGEIACWGYISDPPTGSFRAISAGLDHTCAIRESGEITCWGSNTFRQLGRRDTRTFGRANEAPAGNIQSISAGQHHTCAIRANKAVACWGYSDAGTPRDRTGSYTAVSVGESHTCAIRESSGEIECWVWNSYRNRYGEANAPAGSYRAVSAGRDHTCAIRESGEITCWGSNFYGQFPVQTE